MSDLEYVRYMSMPIVMGPIVKLLWLSVTNSQSDATCRGECVEEETWTPRHKFLTQVDRVEHNSTHTRCMLDVCTPNNRHKTVTETRTHTQPFYDPLSETTRVGRYQKWHLPSHTWNVLWESVIILDFMRHGGDNRGRCTNNPAGPSMPSPPTSPIFYAGRPSCSKPSQFILA